MVNIFGLNEFMALSSFVIGGIITLVVAGVVAIGVTIGAYKGGKFAIKYRAAKKEYKAVQNSMDLVEMVKGEKALKESVKTEAEKQEKLEAERKNNLETANQNLDVKNMQPANQEENPKQDLDEDLELQKIISSNLGNRITEEEFNEFVKTLSKEENESTSDENSPE